MKKIDMNVFVMGRDSDPYIPDEKSKGMKAKNFYSYTMAFKC